jgi:uncharacterized RDD family membrane protein YckC
VSPGFGRRFAALIYDALLVTAFLLLYTSLALFANGGKAIVPETAGAWVFLYYAGEIAVIAGYHAACCHLTGHTLGMRAWRLRVQTPAGALLSWPRCLLRFVCGVIAWVPLGLGVLWMYLDRDHLTLADRWSGSRVVKLD